MQICFHALKSSAATTLTDLIQIIISIMQEFPSQQRGQKINSLYVLQLMNLTDVKINYFLFNCKVTFVPTEIQLREKNFCDSALCNTIFKKVQIEIHCISIAKFLSICCFYCTTNKTYIPGQICKHSLSNSL